MLDLLIELVVLILICGVLYWATTRVPLPRPVRLAVDIVFAIIVVAMLLTFMGWGPWPWRWHHRW